MAKKKFWEFKNDANTDNAELLLYGEISDFSWWGDEVTPKQFKQELDALGDVKDIKVFINSPGGDVFAGQAIYSMLKRSNANIIVYVDGLAASIASVIAMAGDTVIMPKNAMMMIHNPWTIALGTAEDFRKLADDMDKIRESIINVYESKSGMDVKKIIDLMDAETWLTAEEAVSKGLADQIEESKQVAASLNGSFLMVNGHNFDLSKYDHLPKITPSPPDNQLDQQNNSLKKQDNNLLFLYEKQLQINKNHIGGKFDE